MADDDRALRSMLTSMLERAGFSVTGAADGAEALAHIKHRKFDLVLLDVWMPNMTGLEVLARVKDKPGRPKVIVMTGDNTPETLLNAVREQAYQYVNKPFSAKGVVEMVERALASEAGPPIEVLSARPEWIELLVPCEREAAERIQDFLLQAKSDLPQEVREAVGQAFRELLLNAIEWGGDLDPNQKVRISCLRTRRMVLYRIADPGRGFKFEGLTHAATSNPPDSPIDHLRVRDEKGLRPGGFGILLTRAVVDELLYNEAQNEVAFVKYLDGGPKS
ncbi:MAG TPA: response regulator [Terriglobales bacterium]|nr:response regulator [Terriglobales bacterium]